MFHRTAGSSAVAGITAGYTCKETQGAVLVLNSPAHSESIFQSVSLRKYMRRHHREWYDYARNVLDQNVSREAIVLVTGWSKTSPDWKAVAFTRSDTGYNASLGANALGVVGAEVRGTRSRESEPPTMHREGALYFGAPPNAIDVGESSEDQCIFVKRHMIKWRGLRIVAGAGYHQPRRAEGGGVGGGVVATEEEEDDEDPLANVESEVSDRPI